MTSEEAKEAKQITKNYLNWMYSRIKGSVPIGILKKLYNMQFIWIVPMDKNRASDGINLRSRFIFEAAYGKKKELAVETLDRPCTVLEMMFAMALRMEESILRDDEKGDRTGRWFAMMCDNIGILDHESELKERVHKFLNREYLPNGNGNIFYIPDCPDDLRYLEIWQQMVRYVKTLEDE